MKLRKRALSLLLVLACMISLVSAAFAYSSFDQFMAAQGRLSGVDYTRIKQDTQRAIKIGFEIGSKHFRGVLARGKKLDNATTDEIIRRVMDFHELTTNKLVDLRSDVEFAKTQREPFDANYWLEAAGQLLHLNNLVKAADVAQGKLSGADYCRQYLESKPTMPFWESLIRIMVWRPSESWGPRHMPSKLAKFNLDNDMLVVKLHISILGR